MNEIKSSSFDSDQLQTISDRLSGQTQLLFQLKFGLTADLGGTEISDDMLPNLIDKINTITDLSLLSRVVGYMDKVNDKGLNRGLKRLREMGGVEQATQIIHKRRKTASFMRNVHSFFVANSWDV